MVFEVNISKDGYVWDGVLTTSGPAGLAAATEGALFSWKFKKSANFQLPTKAKITFTYPLPKE